MTAPPIKNEGAMSLSDEQIDAVTRAHFMGTGPMQREVYREFARAIETAVREKGGEPEPIFEHDCDEAGTLRLRYAALAAPVGPETDAPPPRDARPALSALLYAVTSARAASREGASREDKRESGEAYELAEKAIFALAMDQVASPPVLGTPPKADR